MKTLQMTASAVALGALALSAGADTTTAWWNLNFNDITTTSWTDDVLWEISGVGSFNKSSAEDASDVVDSYKDVPLESKALELNTNGGDLVFAPGQRPDAGEGVVVDADVFFIASEQDPTITEVTGKPVQAALYLYASDNGDTPEFRAFSYGDLGNEWVPLSDFPVTEDNLSTGIWRRVQITYVGNNVTYKIGAKGADLSNVAGETISRANSNVAGSFHEVVFKGTGLVDNFVGQSLTVETIKYHYLASVVGGSGLEVAEASVDGSTATFFIPLTDDDSNPLDANHLTRIEVIGTDGTTVARTITVSVSVDDSDPENVIVSGTFTEGGEPTPVEDYGPFSVNVSAFIATGAQDETQFTVLKLYYGSSTPPEEDEYYDTGDEAAFTAELTTALQAAEAPITFDPADGFTVSFNAPISGTYVLVAAPTPDADFDTETGDGEAVDTSATVEAGETVELSDEATVGSNAPAARFYKIKLVNGVKPAANAGE